MKDDEKDLIAAVLRDREELARFFANQPEMERWVVREFLTRLGLDFRETELISPPQHDNVDVVFRGACFQVKEIYDPAERRGTEIREALRLANEATTAEELDPPVVGRDIVLSDLAELIHSQATSYKYPPRERSALDLLCYVSRPYCGFNESPETVGERLGSLGWRSISCLLGQRPYILTATSDAPDFLRES